MSEEKPAKLILKTITDIGGYVAALIFYLAAIRGVADTPYPKTTGLLTILATSIVIVSWRWSQIKRKKRPPTRGGVLVAGDWKPQRLTSWHQQLLDPFKPSSREYYVLPLLRRQMEGGVLFSLIVLTLGWSGVNARGVIDEWASDPLMSCSPSNQGDRSLILVADLLQTSSQPELLISDKIYEALLNHQSTGNFDICRLLKTIQLSTIARKTAEEYKADVIIWGRSDVIYEIHLEVPAFDQQDRKLSELSSVEAASVEFQFKEPSHIAYVTQFALSEILLLNGQVIEGRTGLANLLNEARQDGMDRTHPEDLANGYFLLGLFYEPDFGEYPDEQKALTAYQNAMDLNPNLYDAWFNHGLILSFQGRTEEALTDFTYLIEKDTPLKASAYVQRAQAQLESNPEAALRDVDAAIALDPAQGYFFRGVIQIRLEDYRRAIEDLEKAIALDPQGFYNYHLLGQAQLLAGEFEAAKQTYVQMIPYLDEAARDQVIVELQEDTLYAPEIKAPVEEIIRSLQAARLP